MRKNRRIAALMMAATLAASMTGCQSQQADTTTAAQTTAAATEAATEAAGTYTPGTYSATVTGMKEMTVTVTFDADAITDIQLEHEETPGIGVPVCDTMPGQIIELQGLGIDAVSGATLTSNAILEGVADCVEQAGGDVEALKAVKPEVVKEADEELTADVVVIGAGGAGMAAAVTANQAGKSVIVIEKTASMGGNTALCECCLSTSSVHRS